MKLELVVRQLVDFGLTDKEALTYLTLLTAGRATAGQVARKLQVNRMLIYRSMEKLCDRGLVKATMEKPMKYVPLPLDNAVRLLIKETEGKLTQMKYRHNALIQEWNALETDLPQTDTLSFRVVQGRKQIYSQLSRLFNAAETSIKLIVSTSDLTTFQYSDLDDLLKKASKKGVKVQIVVQCTNNERLDIIGTYVNFAELRLVPVTRATRLFMIDDRQLMLAFASAESMALNTKQDTCLFIESAQGPSLMTLVDMFSSIWDSADDLATHAAGSDSENIKILRDEKAYRNMLQEMLSKARSEIVVGIPRDAPFAMKRELIQQTDQKAKGIGTRLVLSIDAADLTVLEKLGEKIEAHHTDILQNMQFVVVDKREILLTLYFGEPGDDRRCKYIWSNSQTYLESIMGFVEEVWKRSTPSSERVRDVERNEISKHYMTETRSILERSGWTVHTPGLISCKAGEVLEFGLVAENPSGMKLAAEFIMGGSEQNLAIIASLYGKGINCGIDDLYLIAHPPVGINELKLAQYYNITLVETKSLEGALPRVINAMTKKTLPQVAE